MKNIEAFVPYRNEVIQILFAIARYDPKEELIESLHRFFESLIPYMFRPESATRHVRWDFDNFRFIIHELFLYAIAILIKQERFQQASMLLSQRYFVQGNSDYGRDAMVSFSVFRQYVESLEYRNKRLDLRRLSLRADLLKERCQTTGIDFRYLMQTDFVLCRPCNHFADMPGAGLCTRFFQLLCKFPVRFDMALVVFEPVFNTDVRFFVKIHFSLLIDSLN